MEQKNFQMVSQERKRNYTLKEALSKFIVRSNTTCVIDGWVGYVNPNPRHDDEDYWVGIRLKCSSQWGYGSPDVEAVLYMPLHVTCSGFPQEHLCCDPQEEGENTIVRPLNIVWLTREEETEEMSFEWEDLPTKFAEEIKKTMKNITFLRMMQREIEQKENQ